MYHYIEILAIYTVAIAIYTIMFKPARILEKQRLAVKYVQRGGKKRKKNRGTTGRCFHSVQVRW